MIPKSKLIKLKRKLWGHYSEVAQKSGYSTKSVQRVMNGQSYNELILSEAIKISKRIDYNKNQLIKEI